MGKFSLIGKVALVLLFLFWIVLPAFSLLDAHILFSIGRRGAEIDVVVLAVVIGTYVLVRKIQGKKGLWEKGGSERYPRVLDGDALMISFFVSSILWYLYRFFMP